jgi:hypothetical protein
MFSSGKFAIAECDRCGFRFKLTALKKLTIKTKNVSIKVCHECWEMDHPQLQLGMYPVNDPQAVREPRRDNSYYQSGYDVNGFPSGGSRQIQWGWAPVGMKYDFNETPNALQSTGVVNSVTIS